MADVFGASAGLPGQGSLPAASMAGGDSADGASVQQNTTSQTDTVESAHQVSQTEVVANKDGAAQTPAVHTHSHEQQTHVVDTQHTEQQTPVVGTQHTEQQTPVVDTQHSEQQTPVVDYQHTSQQTPIVELQAQHQQTEPKELADTLSQTEFKVRIVPPQADMETQAGSWCPQDVEAQTINSMSLEMECYSQTDPKEEDSAGCQTDNPALVDQDTQAVASMGQAHSQTEMSDQDVSVQATVEAAVCEAQTDMSMDSQVESAVQAVQLVSSQEVQACAYYVLNESQTDSSMALLVEGGVQVSADISEQHAQTDNAVLQEGFSQTELEVLQQASQTEVVTLEGGCQAVVVALDSEMQTDPEVAPELPQEEQMLVAQDGELLVDGGLVTSQEGVLISQQDGLVLTQPEGLLVSQPDGLLASQDSGTSYDVPDLESPLKRVVHVIPQQFSEEGCQTDPVTIIIGDASFLVKKLKGSAMSPTKVSSMGNEIEIELRADDEDTPYDMPEKEHVVAAPAPRGRGVVAASRVRGPRTRGGGGMYPYSGRGNRTANYHNPGHGGNYHGGGGSGPEYYGSSAGAVGKYSCPVCSDTFHESPALYEHLQVYHAEAFNLIKKPKGREGKTIVPKPRVRSPEPEPPVLTPVAPIMEHGGQVVVTQALSQAQPVVHRIVHQVVHTSHQAVQPQQHVVQVQAPQQVVQVVEAAPHLVQAAPLVLEAAPQEVEIAPQEMEAAPQVVQIMQAAPHISQAEPEPTLQQVEVDVGLFEDPGMEAAWQSPNKSRKRTLARRQITDEEGGVEGQGSVAEEFHIIIQREDEEEEVPAGGTKRKHEVEEILVKRVRVDDEEAQFVSVASNEAPTEDDTATLTQDVTPRRRGRPPRSATAQATPPTTSDNRTSEERSPRTRGRLRTPRK